MPTSTPLLAHARAALDRSALLLNEMQHGLQLNRSGMGSRHREAADAVVLALARRHRLLVDAFTDMEAVEREQLAPAWRRFFTAYDGYLEAVRDAKCLLAMEEYWDSLGTTAAVARESPHAPTKNFG